MDASAASGVLNIIIFVGVFERVKVKFCRKRIYTREKKHVT